MEPDDPVIIGFIAAPHGVRGTVRVRAAGTGRHLREGVEPAVDGRRRRIIRSRETPKGFLVDLEGIRDREEAAGLRGGELTLDRRELDEPGEDEFYVGDLIGLHAVDGDGRTLGEISDTYETPAHEVLIVGGDEDLYVPFTREHVPVVDFRAGKVVVKPPGAP